MCVLYKCHVYAIKADCYPDKKPKNECIGMLSASPRGMLLRVSHCSVERFNTRVVAPGPWSVVASCLDKHMTNHMHTYIHISETIVD